MLTQHHLPERRACRLVGLSRDSYRTPPQPCPATVELSSRTIAIAQVRRRFGSRRIHVKCLTVADDFSHESVEIAVNHGISGQYVTRILDHAAVFRGYPLAVRTDNEPEFTSRAFMGWASSQGTQRQVPRRMPL